MFMREPRIPIDIERPKEEAGQCTGGADYVARLRHAIEEAHRLAEVNAEAARKKQKAQHDRRVRSAKFTVGDRVLVANKGVRGRHKIVDRWEEIPYVVVRQIPGSLVYVVRELGTGRERTLNEELLTACTFDPDETEEVDSDLDNQTDGADDDSSSVSSEGTCV